MNLAAQMATMAGIEPATYSLGNCCSIQLSYIVGYEFDNDIPPN